MADSTQSSSTPTVPKWLNASMKVALKTPGVQNVLGKSIALITFTGRKSGKQYSTPITYYRDGDTILMVTRKRNLWWRNFDMRPEMELRLAGQTVRGHAAACVDDPDTLSLLSTFLQHNRQDAKYYNVHFGPDGTPNEDELRAILPDVVVLRVALT